MLKTQFPRLLGDIGNPDTFGGQVIYEIVDSATVSRVVTRDPIDSSLKAELTRATQALEQQGATVIGTSCGFLISMQASLQSAVSVPVMTSSLVLLPEIRQQYGQNAVIGVLTFDDTTLAASSYSEYVDSNCVLGGLAKDGELFGCISHDLPTLDSERAKEEVLQCASTMIEAELAVDLFLIECTNISPFKESLRAAFGLPVFDLVDALRETASAPACPN